jgi:hypothetical protein
MAAVLKRAITIEISWDSFARGHAHLALDLYQSSHMLVQRPGPLDLAVARHFALVVGAWWAGLADLTPALQRRSCPSAVAFLSW